MIVVTEKQWFEIGDGFKGITPLTERRQVAEQAIVKGGSMKMLTEGINFVIQDKEGVNFLIQHKEAIKNGNVHND